MARRIYKGTGSGYPVYSVEGNYIYSGTGEGYPVYSVEGNYIYRGTGGGYPIYRIDGNYIYRGTGGGYPIYRIDGNYIYEEADGRYPIYRIEESTKKDIKPDPTVPRLESSGRDSIFGVSFGSAVASILINVISISVAIYVGKMTSSFGVGFIVYWASMALLLGLFGGFKKNIGGICGYILIIIITLFVMNS